MREAADEASGRRVIPEPVRLLEALEIVPPLFLLGIQPLLDQGQDGHQNREECDYREAEEGDVLVVDPSGGADAVGGEGRGSGDQGYQDGQDGGDRCGDSASDVHALKSTATGRMAAHPARNRPSGC